MKLGEINSGGTVEAIWLFIRERRGDIINAGEIRKHLSSLDIPYTRQTVNNAVNKIGISRGRGLPVITRPAPGQYVFIGYIYPPIGAESLRVRSARVSSSSDRGSPGGE